MNRNLLLPADQAAEKFLRLGTPADVAALLEVTYKTLIYHLYRVPADQRYTRFEIPKKAGGTRFINTPNTSLKILQKKLNFVLQQVYRPKASVQGFVNGRSIVTNASKHAARRSVLNIDLQDFFPSINFGRVRGMFMARPYRLPEKVSTVLAQICCFQNQLPQGAPTSPIVSNMVSSRLDTRLQRLAQDYRCIYTRFADDITFSTTRADFPEDLASLTNDDQSQPVVVGARLIQAIEDNGFRINQKKTRLQFRDKRLEVTGLTVNKFPNVQKKYVSQIRAMLHAWLKFGYAAAQAIFVAQHFKKHRNPIKPPIQFRQVVIGKLNFLSMIRGSQDKTFVKYARLLSEIDPEFKVIYDFKIQRQLDRNNPNNAVWVMEGDNRQGTGFFLENIGLVTCWHVLDTNLKAFKPESHTFRFDVRPLRSNRDIDLAVIEIDVHDPICLHRGDSTRLAVGDQIRVLGFPNYDRGHTIQVFHGRVSGFKDNFFGSRRIMVDAAIISGNSGGPVLNDANEVVGVAFRGSERVEDRWKNEAGFTPIESIDLVHA